MLFNVTKFRYVDKYLSKIDDKKSTLLLLKLTIDVLTKLSYLPKNLYKLDKNPNAESLYE